MFGVFFYPFQGDFDEIGLFQAFFNQLVRQAIGTKQSPASVPVKLGSLLVP
jgi:hypothetical protein